MTNKSIEQSERAVGQEIDPRSAITPELHTALFLRTERLMSYNDKEEDDRKTQAHTERLLAQRATFLAQAGQFEKSLQTIEKISSKRKKVFAFVDLLFEITDQNSKTEEDFLQLYTQVEDTILDLYWIDLSRKECLEVLLDLLLLRKYLHLDTPQRLQNQIVEDLNIATSPITFNWAGERAGLFPLIYTFSQHGYFPPESHMRTKENDILEFMIEEHTLVQDAREEIVVPYTFESFVQYAQTKGVSQALEKANQCEFYIVKVVALAAVATCALQFDREAFEDIFQKFIGLLEKPYFRAYLLKSEPSNSVYRLLSTLADSKEMESVFTRTVAVLLQHYTEVHPSLRLGVLIDLLQVIAHSKFTTLRQDILQQAIAVYKAQKIELRQTTNASSAVELSYAAQFLSQNGLELSDDFSRFAMFANTSKPLRNDADTQAHKENALLEVCINCYKSGEVAHAWNLAKHYLTELSRQEFELYILADSQAIGVNPFSFKQGSLTKIINGQHFAKLEILQQMGRARVVAEKEITQAIEKNGADVLPLLAMQVATKNSRSQSLKKIEEILLSGVDQNSLKNFLDSIEELWFPQDYSLASTILFRIIGHSKTSNYKMEIPEYKYVVDVLASLVRMNNGKAARILEELFANEKFKIINQSQYIKIKDILFSSGFWPSSLKLELERRSGTEIAPKYLELMRYLLYTYNTVLSDNMLKFIEPDFANSPKTYAEMITEIVQTFQAVDSVVRPLNPVTFARTIQTNKHFGQGIFITEGGQYTYGYVGSLDAGKFNDLHNYTSQLEIDANKLQRFAEHLIRSGIAEQRVAELMNNLMSGIHPVTNAQEKLLSHTFEMISDIDYEIELLESQIIQLLGMLNDEDVALRSCLNEHNKFSIAQIVTAIASLRKKYGFDVDIEDIKNKWITYWMGHFISTRSGLDEDIKILALRIEELLPKRSKENKRKKQLKVSFVQKGYEPMRFARATDVVRCCVNSDTTGYLGYMPRRLASPTSFTFDITDIETQRIIGNVETRLLFNAEASTFELGCVGIYSAHKNKAMIREVLNFIEQSIAIPLRLSAINIASIHGGTITQPDGYEKVKDLQLVGFSEVLNKNGKPLYARRDDIGSEYENEFEFSGFRKQIDEMSFLFDSANIA